MITDSRLALAALAVMALGLGLGLAEPAVSALFPTYDIVTFMPDLPAPGAIIRIALARRVKLTAGLPNTACVAKSAAHSAATVTLNKVSGGVTTAIGTLVWSGGSTQCSPSFAADVQFAIGDLIEEVFPSPADGTMANIAINIRGIREE